MSDNQLLTLMLNQSQVADLVSLLMFVCKTTDEQHDHVERFYSFRSSQAFDDYLSCIISKDELDSIQLSAAETAVATSAALEKQHQISKSLLSVLTGAGAVEPNGNARPEQPAPGLSTGFHTTFSTESVDNMGWCHD